MLDRQECILPKREEKAKVMDLRDRAGLQDEDKEERGKPELYTIQSFQIQIIMNVLIWLNKRKREKRERNIDVTQARVLVTFSSA